MPIQLLPATRGYTAAPTASAPPATPAATPCWPFPGPRRTDLSGDLDRASLQAAHHREALALRRALARRALADAPEALL